MLARPKDTTGSSRDRSRSGAAAIELAILLPFLLLMFTAALDFGRIYHTAGVLTSASSIGSTYASGTPFTPGAPGSASSSAQAAAVREGASLDPPLQAEQVTVSISGGYATVTVVYDYPLITGVLFPDRTVRLERTTVSKIAPRPGD